jgi:hypothetical protein
LLAFYARGSNSDLTLSSNISGVSDTTDLIAQRNVNLDGNSIDSQRLRVIAGENIAVGAISAVTINGSEASFLIPNAGGTIVNSSGITLAPSGNLTLNGANGLSLTVDNSNRGHIGGSAAISIAASDIAVGSLNVSSTTVTVALSEKARESDASLGT